MGTGCLRVFRTRITLFFISIKYKEKQMPFPTLSSFNIKPVNTSLLPAPQDGWRPAMLVQYPDSGSANGLNDAWTITTSLTRSITFMGRTARTSSYNPTQLSSNVQSEFPEHRAIWLAEADGFTPEECSKIVDDYAYCYLHDTLSPPAGFDTCVLTIDEYNVQVLGASADAPAPAPVPEPVHAV